MRGRVPVLVAAALVTAACVLAWVSAPALAQGFPASTYDEVAVAAHFPIWKSTRTAGLRAHVKMGECGIGATATKWLLVEFRKPHSRQRLTLAQAPQDCGNAGEARLIKHVRIHGARAALEVGCVTLLCHSKLSDGFRHGFQVIVKLPARRAAADKPPRRTFMVANSVRMPLRAVLRLLRGTRVVRTDRPSLSLRLFLSSDGTVWCGIGIRSAGDRWCSTHTPQHGAVVNADGTTLLCGDAQPADPVCIQNWDDATPRLRDGQRSDYGGYVCLDQAGAVTCTVKAGAMKGHGFHVSATGSDVIGP